MSGAAPAVPFGSAELRAGETKVVVVPALGGKIASLEMAGREWLWRNDAIPFQLPVDGAPYGETGDSGGYDEFFPTVASCTLPATAGRFGGLTLPDRGELWSQPSTFAIETRSDGVYAACGWVGRRMPYRFVRGIFVSDADRVELRYAVTNDGAARLPFIWAAHPLLPLTEQTRLELPQGARVRVGAQYGIELGGHGAEHRWPRLPSRGRVLDLSQPDAVASAYACQLFVDVPVGRAAVEEGGARLEVTFDPQRVPTVALWINRRGWTPFRRGRPYLNVALGPCLGAPDSLSEAMGAWRSAQWLAPGETREWTVTWRGSR